MHVAVHYLATEWYTPPQACLVPQITSETAVLFSGLHLLSRQCLTPSPMHGLLAAPTDIWTGRRPRISLALCSADCPFWPDSP